LGAQGRYSLGAHTRIVLGERTWHILTRLMRALSVYGLEAGILPQNGSWSTSMRRMEFSAMTGWGGSNVPWLPDRGGFVGDCAFQQIIVYNMEVELLCGLLLW
jgi:hypothetical protein